MKNNRISPKYRTSQVHQKLQAQERRLKALVNSTNGMARKHLQEAQELVAKALSEWES